MGIPSSVLRFAALGAAVLAWFLAAPHLPGLSLWWDIVLVSFVVMPATLLLVLWALPLWNRRWLPVGAGVLALAAFGVMPALYKEILVAGGAENGRLPEAINDLGVAILMLVLVFPMGIGGGVQWLLARIRR